MGTTKQQDKTRNPLTMGAEIKSEAVRCLNEYRDGKKAEEIEGTAAEKDAGVIACITRIRQTGSLFRLRALAGSPLYIALYRKQYDEAEEILNRMPDTAEPGYAVQQAEVVFDPEQGQEPQIKFLMEKAVYLEEILLTDEGIPDALCLELWRHLLSRKDIDAPCFCPGLKDKAIRGTVPQLILEFPSRIELRKKYGDLGFVSEKRWTVEIVSKEDIAIFHSAAKADLELFWKGMKGLYRLKKLDKDLYGKHVNEQIAAHLIIRMMYCLFPFVRVEHMMDGSVNFSEQKHISELSRSIDAAANLRRLKKGLEKLGFSEIPGDVLWNACIDYLQHEQNAWSFWVAIDIWNEIFDGKFELNISFRERERGIQLLRALVNDSGQVSPSHLRITKISDTKVFLEEIDRILWVDGIEDEAKQEKGDNSFWKARHSFEESVLRENDRELLLNCFEKNLFPKEDVKFLYVTAMAYKKNDFLPLILLKEHECL